MACFKMEDLQTVHWDPKELKFINYGAKAGLIYNVSG